MADKKISQLDLVAQINNDAVIPMSQENGGEQTTYKALITAIGAKIAEGLTFSNLATTAKNLVGAINEIEAGGGGGGAAILIGTTAPSSSQGSNGNLYIQYTAGTGGADDTVDAVFIKLDGTWCEITTDYADLLNKPQVNGNTLSGNKSNSDLGIYGKTINMSSTDTDKVADRIEALETSVSGLVTETGGGGPISTVGGTYQIPSSVLAHKIIVICFRRYGYFGQAIISKTQMLLSAYGAATRLWGDSQNYWDIKISDSGVITLVAINGTAFPFVDCFGIG